MKHKRIIPYNRKLKERARNLRNNSTLSEVLLWKYLKGKQRLGHDFDRQKPIDNYIVDFFCNELMLAIEIDGSSHDEKIEYDARRERRLRSLGLEILHFTDREVKRDTQAIVMAIDAWIEERMKERGRGGTHPASRR